MNTTMIQALCPGVQVDRYDGGNDCTSVKLVLEPVAWTGVTVTADKTLTRRDGDLVEEWRVRVNWPSCGGQDTVQTERFARLLTAAVYVANELMREKTGISAGRVEPGQLGRVFRVEAVPDTADVDPGPRLPAVVDHGPLRKYCDCVQSHGGYAANGMTHCAGCGLPLRPLDSPPQFPEGINWKAERTWLDFRATYEHCQGHAFLFCGVRFFPAYAKMLLDAYAPEGGK